MGAGRGKSYPAVTTLPGNHYRYSAHFLAGLRGPLDKWWYVRGAEVS
ncbi:hypothetical protein SAMN05421772_10867 [Paracoccus saliphilus]|uniref:Uncharacterized protein n=1 Tax=Paracoccus saliphilus TaxID=405559 RepID=A0AA46A612_9RHOB|nr:hypothetical protein SAMN05421772_10867 [Paracoccus saliphilus]